MKKHFTNFLKFALSLGLGIGLIYWFVSKMSPSDKEVITNTFKRANYFWIILAPVLGLVSNFSRAERWRMLLEPVGYKPGYINTYCSVMMMYLFNLFFPRLGEVTRCTILARYENVPLDKSIGTMVVERLVDLVTILILGSVMFAFEYKRLAGYSPNIEVEVSPVVKWASLVLVIVAVIGSVIYIEVKFGFAKLKQIMKERMIGFWEGLKSIKNVKRPFVFIFHSVFIWFCYYLMIYLSLPALPETASLGMLAALTCLFFGGFAIVATPGGIGAYPAVISQVLGLYGVSEIVGYGFGSVVWVAQIGSVLLGGVICLILLAILNREPALE